MVELNFAQNFSLIALNAQDSIHLTTAKKISLRCIAAAAIFDLFLDGTIASKEGTISFSKQALKTTSVTLYQDTVLNAILNTKDSYTGSLSEFLRHVTKLSNKHLKKIELTIADSLKGSHMIEEIPSLIGCDLLYHSAGVSMKEYRSKEALYTRLTESLKAEILEEGPVTDESIFMMWLLRESGCLYDIFSKDEVKLVAVRMSKLFESSPLAKQIFTIDIHKSLEMAIKSFLAVKKAAMSTPTGLGINFAFPFFDRSQSVFIDTEEYFSNKEQRLHDIKLRLEHYGHTFTIVHEGDVPLIKIDNLLYEAIPTSTRSRFPVHGVRLRKYPLY